MFEDLRPKLLHEQVTSHLREIIVRGELEPGTAVDELALCTQFGISRTPIREALKVLAVEELVELRPRQGAVISSITTKSLGERFDFVTLIEASAARRACAEGATAALADVLERVTHGMRTAIRAGDRARHSRLNEEFHAALVASLNNDVVRRTHEGLLSYLRRSRYYAGSQADRRRDFLREHQAVIDALREGNADAAEAAARTHLSHVRDHVLAALPKQD